MGPLSFLMYTSPLEDIIKSHGVDSMIYADDTQIYAFKSRKDGHNFVLSKLEACIRDIRSWSTANEMKLNDEKTEIIHITSRFRSATSISSLHIGNSLVEPATSARNLGVVFDQNLNRNLHVNNICRAASHALYKIGKIRNHLDMKTTEMLVHAFVSSRIDSCNSLLYGLPDCQLNKLQRIQNSAARLITRSKKFTHITPILHQLHWLPVKSRINFKVLLLTFKCVHGIAPTYLQDLINMYTPSRSLRSSSMSLLLSPSVSTKSYGHRSFQFSAALLWNNLPTYIKEAQTVTSFKTLLKHHLFSVI